MPRKSISPPKQVAHSPAKRPTLNRISLGRDIYVPPSSVSMIISLFESLWLHNDRCVDFSFKIIIFIIDNFTVLVPVPCDYFSSFFYSFEEKFSTEKFKT